MARLRISAAARKDLEAIRDRDVREFGPTAADRHLGGFERLFALLREQPLAGQERPEIGDAIRPLAHPPHRLLYRYRGDTVLIVRILHHARDVQRAMRRR